MNLNFGHSPLAPPMRPGAMGPSFLPEDYLRRKRERRSDFIALTLFCIVMFAVVAAFFVTNRKWTVVKAEQSRINTLYTAEGKKIDQLKVLESQRQEMLDKAEITAALIERVPRSILLAELINRMPEQLSLTDLKLTGKRIKEAPAPDPNKDKAKAKPKSLASGGAGKTGEEKEAAPKPVPPKYDFSLELIGLAASDQQVADYQAALKDCPLLEGVDLVFTGSVTLDDVERRKFRVEAKIKPTADARNIQPLHVQRRDGSAARMQLGADGKPTPQTPLWIRKHGLVTGKPGAGDQTAEITPHQAPPAGPTADATPGGHPGQPQDPSGDHP